MTELFYKIKLCKINNWYLLSFTHHASLMITCRLSFLVPTALALCFITSACNTVNRKNIQLKLNPQENKTYQLSLVRTTSTQYWERLSTDTFTLEGRFRLEKHEDSLVRLRFYFSKLELKAPPARSTMIDSMPDGSRRARTISITDERDALLNRFQGMSMTVILNNKGQVQQVEELDKLTDSLSAIAQVEVSSVRIMLRDYLGGDAFKDIFNSVLYMLPGKQVVESDRWANDFTLTTKAPVQVSNLYTLQADNNDTATVAIQSLISATAGDGGRVYMKGKQDGFARLSRESGLPYYRETTGELITETGHYDEVRKDTLVINRKEKLTLKISRLGKD